MFWGIEDFQRRPIEHLPDWSLLQLHSQMQLRHADHVNALNHSAAVMVDIDQATKANRSELDPKKWYPYQSVDIDHNLDSKTARLLLDVKESGELPAWATMALISNGIIEQCQAIVRR